MSSQEMKPITLHSFQTKLIVSGFYTTFFVDKRSPNEDIYPVLMAIMES